MFRRLSVLLASLFLLGIQNANAQTFEGGSAFYDSGSGLLLVNMTWSGLDSLPNGLLTVVYDTDAGTNPFEVDVTDLVGIIPGGGDFISTPSGIASQALVASFDDPITTAGSVSITAVFSGVSSDVLGEALDVGGNWDGSFEGIPNNNFFQVSDAITVQEGEVNPSVVSLGLTVIPTLGSYGTLLLPLLLISAVIWQRRKNASRSA